MKFKVVDGLIFRRIENEYFIYNGSRQVIHTFNDSGSFIWGMFETGSSEKDVAEALVDEYEVDEESAKKDVYEFLETLKKRGIIVQ